MQFPVLIETIGEGCFRATTGEPLSLTTEAATREEALTKLQGLLQSALGQGKELVSMPINSRSSLPPGAGMFENDPLFDDWQEAIAEYRRQKDSEEGLE